MKIVCVYKTGGDYNSRYPEALYHGIKENCSKPFDFYCLTDVPKMVESFANPILLKHDYPNWFCKMELFDPRVFNDDEPILYFDLDVLILKPIDALITLCVHSIEPLMTRDPDPVAMQNDWPNTSIMTWRGPSMHPVFEAFNAMSFDDVIRLLQSHPTRAGQRTDQGFIRSIFNPLKFQDFLPEDYMLFKYDFRTHHGKRTPELLDDVNILCWTGKPRFHEMVGEDLPIKGIWESRIHLPIKRER